MKFDVKKLVVSGMLTAVASHFSVSGASARSTSGRVSHPTKLIRAAFGVKWAA